MNGHDRSGSVYLPEARSSAAFACRLELQLPLASLSSASFAQGHARYRIDEQLGPITFVVGQVGLFSLEGALSRFTCDLRLNRAAPLDMHIDLSLDVTSLVLSEPEEQSWQPFIPWFDVNAHPSIRFRSSAVVPSGSDRYAVRGLLDLGGVTQLLSLEAVVTGRRVDPITATEVAELMVTGGLRCSAFGMPADQMFVSDRLELCVQARIELET